MRSASVFCGFCIWAALASMSYETAIGQATQVERRNQLSSPGLIRSSDRPVARVNVIRQSKDRLYVAGLDHCVRSYLLKPDATIDWATVKTYRWPAWRDERGEILAMELNDDGSRLAVGGIGLIDGLVAEFDVESEKLIRAKSVVKNTVTAFDYSSDGALVVGSAYGEVAVWLLSNEVAVLQNATTNGQAVRDVHAKSDGALSIHSGGDLWSFSKGEPSSRLTDLVTADGFLISAQFSADGDRVLIGRRRNDQRSEIMEQEVTTGKALFSWKSPNRWIVDGVRYTNEQQGLIAYGIDDVKVSEQRIEYQSLLVKRAKAADTPKLERIAGTRIAELIATEESVWFCPTESNVIYRQDATGNRWQSDDELGYGAQIYWSRDQRGFCWSDVKGRGQFSFDRKIVSPNFSAQDTYRHKEVMLLIPDLSTPSQLSVAMRDGSRKPVPLQIARDGEASTHITFEKNGKTYVAVGHRFGVSLFEFTKAGNLELVRKMIGHQHMVTGIAVSEDRRLMLTKASDGTICCFTLEPWKYHSELGATFEQQGSELVVTAIDEGGPIWETGLSVGHQIQRIQYEGADLSIKDAVTRLSNAKPGGEWKFVSKDLETVVSSRVLQRPIWKFHYEDQEWILYRWRDYYYDCSIQGDQLVAWFINPDTQSEPIVFNAEKARARFYKPSKLLDLLSLQSLKSERLQVPELVPPVVDLELEEAGDQLVIKATLSAEANALLVGEPQDLSVWVGDLRVSRDIRPKIPSTHTVTVDRKLLRNGSNRLIARAYNEFGVRGDSDFEVVEHKNPEAGSKLWGLVLGVQDYSQARQISSVPEQSAAVPDLNWTVNDARGIEDALKTKTTHFELSDVRLLSDSQVNRKRIAEEMERIRALSRPDDFLVLSFAGHGYQMEDTGGGQNQSSFMLLTADSSLLSKEEAMATSLPIASVQRSSEEWHSTDSLFDELASLPCRKLVIMDACHSGGAVEMVRALTPDFVVGPTVITAAGKNQFAVEVPSKMHGIFTAALLEAAGAKFSQADTDQNKLVTVGELFEYCSRRVPEIFGNSEHFMRPDDFKRGQTPAFWAPDHDQSVPIFSALPAR